MEGTEATEKVAAEVKGLDIMRLARDKSYGEGFSIGYMVGVKVGASLAAGILATAGARVADKDKVVKGK